MKRIVSFSKQYSRKIEREDHWNATTCAVIANGYSKKKVKPDDFLKKKEAPRQKVQTPEEMLDFVKRLAGNKKVVK